MKGMQSEPKSKGNRPKKNPKTQKAGPKQTGKKTSRLETRKYGSKLSLGKDSEWSVIEQWKNTTTVPKKVGRCVKST